jgi:hypothetical protein
VQQGELWLIVAKNDKFIYFHLTDTPNSASNTTAYGGYTVKTKAIMTNQLYSYGYGGAVPVIGNDTDAFLVMTTDTWVNSAFIEGEPQQLSFSTGAVIEHLVHLYDEVQTYSMPRVGSTHWTALQYFAPDGTELTEPFSLSSSVLASSGASSSTDCEALGDKAGQDYITNQRTAMVVLHGVLFPASGILAGLPGLIAEINVASLALMTANLTERVGSAVAAALAEGLCEAGDDIPVLPPIELDFGVADVIFAEYTIVCDRYEDELVGSTGRDDGDGGVIVEGHTERVCAESHGEVKK